jgi:hypothetical protein
LTANEGRKFALTVGTAFLALAAVTLWRGHMRVATVASIAGAAFVIAGVVVPSHLGPVYRGWMAFGLALSKVTTPIFMGIVYFLVITPTGMLRRRFGRNPLVAPGRDSVWVARDRQARTNLTRQF